MQNVAAACAARLCRASRTCAAQHLSARVPSSRAPSITMMRGYHALSHALPPTTHATCARRFMASSPSPSPSPPQQKQQQQAVDAGNVKKAPKVKSDLPRTEVEARILNLLRGYDRVNQKNLTNTAHFVTDLGLDSLDTVEVVMAIEEEFTIEIPDQHADEILTVEQAINYILSRDDAF